MHKREKLFGTHPTPRNGLIVSLGFLAKNDLCDNTVPKHDQNEDYIEVSLKSTLRNVERTPHIL